MTFGVGSKQRIRRRALLLAGVVAVCMVAMGVLLYNMQAELTLESSRQEMALVSQELPATLESADDETKQNEDTYDAIFQSKAESIAFMANNETGFELTDAKMAEYRDLLEVENVLVVSRDGTVLAQAHPSQAMFSHARFNLLRTVFDTGEPSEAVEVNLPDQDWERRYYSARIDDSSMAVVAQDPKELKELVADTGSIESVLSRIVIGQSGYVFAISAQDYTVSYHPNDDLVGQDAFALGFSADNLEHGSYFWINLDGEDQYCYVDRIGNLFYVSAVPESDMSAARDLTVGVILFVFFAVMLLVVLYGVFVMHDEAERDSSESDFVPIGRVRYNKVVGKKAAVLSFVGLLGIVAVSFYMQTLFALSSQSVINSLHVADIQDTIDHAEERASVLTDQYDERYLDKCRTAAYILEQNPSLINHDKLIELADVLQIQYVYVFDNNGVVRATSSMFNTATLSEDTSDQSFEFWKLLRGTEELVQEVQKDDTGQWHQYIGVTMHDDAGNVDGFVQLAILPFRLQTLLSSVEIDNVLDDVKVGGEGFAFAVNRDGSTFAYYPVESLIGESVFDHGMTEQQLKDGYSDYLTVDGQTYYAASGATEGYYLFVAGPEGELMAERVPLTLTTGGIALICLVALFLVLVLSGPAPAAKPPARGEAEGATAAPGASEARMVDVTMPDGRTLRTETAWSRWLARTFAWNEKAPEQKLVTVMKWIGAMAVLVVCVAVVFQDRFFGEGSIFAYILGGEWERGLNIFAFTACLMFACVAVTAASLVKRLLMLFADVLGARGETVCRLLGSFIKYATIVGAVYYCLALLGVDTTALLASAGILSIAISLGAKELVSDILSGLFIIFEGEFRVGDIIEVDGWRGTVVEIGIRTTKVENGDRNIKVIRNSNISNVVNMTKQTSYATCDVGIEYGESLERVEAILERELPLMRRRLPAIVDGPYYKGVVALGDNSVDIRIVVHCAETDRVQLERDLRREMKLLFDKCDISIPYPQVVINKPVEFKKATASEKWQAERFNEEQKEASKNLYDNGPDGKS